MFTVAVMAVVHQIPPSFPESNTLSPSSNVVAPPAEIIDAMGCEPTATILLLREIAPAIESPLPKRFELSNKLIAPLATIVPWKTALSPKLNAPFICQYTWHKVAELIRIIFDNAF